jgi:hypothetical protein
MNMERITKRTSEIIERINAGFGKDKYQSAKPFMNSGAFWDFCIRTIEDPVKMSCIVFANDLGVPPVKSLMTFFDRDEKGSKSFKVTAQESQWVGALMGFVFKFVLDYQNQKERCSVKMHGVITATRFIDGPILEFTK